MLQSGSTATYSSAVCWFGILAALGWGKLTAQTQAQLHNSKVTDIKPVDTERATADALFIQSCIESHQARSLSSLRKLQRAWRLTGRPEILEAILSTTKRLRLPVERLRFSQTETVSSIGDARLLVESASVLSDRRKYSEAAACYRQYLRLNRQNGSHYLLALVQIELGRMLYLSGELESAEPVFQRLMNMLQDPDFLTRKERQSVLVNSGLLWRMMGRTFLLTGDFEQAEACLLNSNRLAKPSTILMNKAELAFAKKQYPQAMDLVVRSLVENPNQTTGFNLVHQILEESSKTQKSQDAISDAERKRIELEWIKRLEQIREKAKSGSLLEEKLMDLYLQHGKQARAIELLEERASQTLSRLSAYHSMLRIHARANQSEQTLKCLAMLICEQPNWRRVEADLKWLGGDRKLLTGIRQRLDELDGNPIADWKQIGIDKNDVPHVIRIAGSSFLMWMGEELSSSEIKTVESLLKEISRSGTARRVGMTWARGCLKQGRLNAAQAGFEFCRQRNRDREKILDRDYEAAVIKGWIQCLASKRETEKALKLIGHLNQLGIEQSTLIHLRGWIYLNDGKLQKALKSHLMLVEQLDRPGVVTSFSGQDLLERTKLEIGMICLLLGQKTIAREYVDQVLDVNPGGPNVEVFESQNRKYAESCSKIIQMTKGE